MERTGIHAVWAGGPPKKKHNHIVLKWDGDQRFDAGRAGGVTHRIDVSGKTGPGPVDTLLNALAACTSVDVLEILAKRRTPATGLEVDVHADRVAAIPARLEHVKLVYRIAGPDIDREHAERAVELAVTKYCSVRDSLDPRIQIDWAVELLG
jgi:putative redox protein